MTAAGKHIIGKQLLELTYNGNTDGIALQRTTESILRKELLPQLEVSLDRYSPGNETISIDRLVLEVALDSDDLENNLVQKIIERLNEALDGKIKEINQVTRPTPTRFVKLLIFYLRNGYLPWWSHYTGTGNWHSFVFEHLSTSLPVHDRRLLQAAIQEAHVQQRIAVQFDESCFWELIHVLSGSSTIFNTWRNDWQYICEWIKSSDQQELFRINSRQALLQRILSAVAGKNMDNQVYQEINEVLAVITKERLEEILPANTLHKEDGKLSTLIKQLTNNVLKSQLAQDTRTKKTNQHRSTSAQTALRTQNKTGIQQKKQSAASINMTQGNKPSSTEDDIVYINNAGLVIVAPYLGNFFNRLELLYENKVNDTARGIALLQHLVTGENDFEEFEVVLPKLLCGIKPDEPILQKYQLTTADKEAASELLQAVITNWSILKNTSLTGLRQSFLQREGKLNMTGGQWHLKVQSSTYDMLLDYLPWNIKMIKLPWMQSLLVVEWND